MTKKYTVEITEVLCRQVEVTASSSNEAIEKVTEQYEAGDIVLGADDFTEFDMQVISEKE